MENVDQRIIDYAKTCKNGEMTTEGFKASIDTMSFSAKAGKVTLQALATVGNMFIGWAISKGIEFIVTKLDDLANASKHAAENAKELASEMNNCINSMSGNISTLSDLNGEYQTLSKGVNQLGENIGLSTEDYDRYKSIIGQISEIMPDLTMYFNAQGEKIAFAKGELADLNKEYEDYIRNQANDYVTKGDSGGNSIQDILDAYDSNESLTGFEQFWYGLKNSFGFVDLDDFTAKEIISELEHLKESTSIDEILMDLDMLRMKSQDGLRPDLSVHENALKYVIFDTLGLTGKSRDELESMTESEYNAIMQKIISYIQSYNAKIKSDMNQVRTALFQETYSKDEFWAIENEDIRNDITTFLSSIDSNIWDALNIKTDNELSTFVNKIVQSLSNNKDGFRDAWNGLFDPELKDLPIGEYTKQIDDFVQTISKTLELDDNEGGHILKVAFGLDTIDDLPKQLTNSIRSITDNHGITDREQYSYLMNEIDFESFTQEQAKLWLTSTLSAENAADAVKQFKDALAAAESEGKEPITFSDIFSLESTDDTLTNLGKISESIATVQNAYETLSDAIDEYNEEGVFSIDTLQSVIALGDNWLDYLVNEDGALKLDKESLEQLTQARLNDMRIQAISNVIDNVSKIENDAAANDYLKSTNYALAESYEGLAKAKLGDARASMEAAVAAGTLSQANMDAAMKKAETDIAKIDKLFSNTGINTKPKTGQSGKTSPSSSSTNDFKEQFDFFERRVKVLDNAVSLLKANLENLTGSFAKNQLLDQNSNLLEERVRNYSDAAKMYQQKALESLSMLDLETQSKIINGSVSLSDYIGEDSKAVTQAMNDYKGWADKVADCTEELANLQTQLRQLELDKFNHIVQDFTDQFDLRDNTKSLIDKQIALFEEAGQSVGKAFYEQQISQTQKQLSLLETEKVQLVNQLNTALASGRIQKGTEEWLEMVKALSDVDGNILDCKKSIETFDNAIQNLHWETFDRVQDTFGNLSDEISNLLGTMKDTEVATPDNQWTAEGLTQLGLYAQQYELATYQASQYANEIDRLNADYLKGKYSATEYADKLADLSSAQWKAVNAAESAKDSILDLNETRVGVVSDGIQKEIDAYKELIDSQTEALDTEKELHEYQNSIAEKSGNIAKMEKQLAAMQNDTTAATVAKRKQLEEQLAQTRADLEETQYQHSVETQKESLNQQYENYETARNQEIESLEESLKDKETIIAVSMESVKQNTQIIAGQITEIANQHGIKVSTALTNSWASGENAIASYGEVLSQQTSAFIGNIMAVETQIYQLQTDADITALSLANMFGATADNLVGQLNASYFAETNLLNMTNALQNSLVNTLQGEYNVSNIVNSLNAVTNAAQKAKEALRSTLQPISQPSRPDETTKSLPGMAAAVAAGNTGILKKYASGTRNITSNQLALTNESGQEIIYRTKDGSILTRLQPGDKVFSNAAVERLWNIGQGIVPHDILKGSAMPPVLPNNISSHSPVNIHYDSMLTFTGDVNDTNHFTKQVRAVAKEVMTDTIKLAEKTRKYGMF